MNDSSLGGASPSLGGRSSATPPLALQRPTRKTPAHFPPIEIGFRSIIVYLTVCVHRRRPLLANDTAAQLIVEAWVAATFWRVGRFVILSDHIHLFCAPNTFPAQPLKKWIACWKNHITRTWTNRSQIPIWQREFWDRQLRRTESYDEKWQYVRNNPVRHGYVSRVEDWPYQGELNVLEWHDR
jgi:putative transposase